MNNNLQEYEDCYYFLYSNCKKGDSCIYRHCNAAKSNTTLCPEWANTKKCKIDCPMRHSFYHIQKKEYCYFETTEQGCTKPNCEYKHRNPVDQRNIVENPNSFENTKTVKHNINIPVDDDDEFYRIIEEENKMIDNEIMNVEQELENLNKYY